MAAVRSAVLAIGGQSVNVRAAIADADIAAGKPP